MIGTDTATIQEGVIDMVYASIAWTAFCFGLATGAALVSHGMVGL